MAAARSAGRYCATRWQISVEQHGKDRLMELRLQPGAVEPEITDLFAEQAAGKPEARARPLNVAVLLHVASQNQGAVALRFVETAVPLAILRRMARDPRIGNVSSSAFNLERNQVLYQREGSPGDRVSGAGRRVRAVAVGHCGGAETG
jgi:hypothetical protein